MRTLMILLLACSGAVAAERDVSLRVDREHVPSQSGYTPAQGVNFFIGVPATLPVTRWELSIMLWDDEVIQRFEGSGKAPARMIWLGVRNDTGALAESGIYRALLRVRTASGEKLTSPVILFTHVPSKELSKIRHNLIMQEDKDLLRLQLPMMLFDEKTGGLSERAGRTVYHLAEFLKSLRELPIMVLGFQDRKAGKRGPFFSQRRAHAVYSSMIHRHDVPAPRMRFRGLGSAKKDGGKSKLMSRKKDRRVEVWLTKRSSPPQLAASIRRASPRMGDYIMLNRSN
ncbi:OmpA family protein [Elusimicrobiota bacterium]